MHGKEVKTIVAYQNSEIFKTMKRQWNILITAP
jgi:hypothetical protein